MEHLPHLRAGRAASPHVSGSIRRDVSTRENRQLTYCAASVAKPLL